MNLILGKKSSLTDVQRAQIVALHGEGYTESKISEKLKCSNTDEYNAIAKHRTDEIFATKNKADDFIKL